MDTIESTHTSTYSTSTQSTSSSTVLSCRGLSVRYGDNQVLRSLDMHVAAGEVYALLGGNGAGKSTTIGVLLGLVQPDAGAVHVCGHDVTREPDLARACMAYVPESVALYEHLSAVENIEYFVALADTALRGGEVIERALDAVGLKREAWHQRVSGFSKGMRQKVAIALALARDVPVLLLDEPTSGLDPQATADFNALLQALKAKGVTILIVTHDLLSAADVADRIGFLSGGRIEEEVAAAQGERFDVGALHRRYSGAGSAP